MSPNGGQKSLPVGTRSLSSGGMDRTGGRPDDETAIRELERLRGAGASHSSLGWPAFWWLDHYEKFASYLNSRFRRVFKNSRIVAY